MRWWSRIDYIVDIIVDGGSVVVDRVVGIRVE